MTAYPCGTGVTPALAGPSGPPDTRPPGHPPPPPPPPTGPTARDLAASLDTVVLLLRTAQLVAADRLAGMDPADRIRLDYGLDMARRAITESQTPARPAPVGGPVSAAAEKLRRSARAVGGAAVVADRAAGPPAPGAGTFSLPPVPTVPSFDNGSVPWPGRPFPVYEVP